ncbi:MAG: regulator of protease activity HflC (stomatin/prohibitin superfamily), partial [Patiriisocius sp.]
MKNLVYLSALLLLTTSCAVVRPGEAGIRQKLGKLDTEVTTQGTVFYNPFTTRVLKESIQTNNLLLSLVLPSKEGLSVDSEISILFRLETSKLPTILENIGP